MPPRYINGDMPSATTIMTMRPRSASVPTESSRRTLRSGTSRVLSTDSDCPGQLKASQAPMSSENARVSVP